MSQEDQEAVHRVVGLWNGHDMEGLLALTDSDVEYINSPTAVEPGTRRGHEAFKGVLQDQWEMLSDAHWEIDRLYERGEEMVSIGRLSRRMPGSETRMEDRVLVAFRFKYGRLIRMEVMGFGETEVRGALKAAGLSE
jgi:ketosteroid isomerase-like protein